MFSPLLYCGCGVLSKGFGGRWWPWELLCADDLVLLANLEEDLRRLIPEGALEGYVVEVLIPALYGVLMHEVGARAL